MSVRHAPNNVPRTVDSPRGKLVYLYLDSVGGATRTEIQEHLGLKAMTLFSTLRTLREEGLVSREDGRYVTAGPV
jgi:Mn-dependent DtxR family transcriptional regulator